jgi:uncharacterized protein YqiB (DUF1249 family)
VRNQYTLIYNHLEKLFNKMGKSYKDMELGESIRLKSVGFMDLVVSRIADDVIALEHNYIQEGDLMVDPRIDIRLIEHSEELKMAEALNYEQHNLGIYQEIYLVKDGKRYVNTQLKNEVNRFLHQWLSNIEDQGFSL